MSCVEHGRPDCEECYTVALCDAAERRERERRERPPTFYVCERCGHLGPMVDFDGDCAPGWTHGRLIRVRSCSCDIVPRPA